jgi:hypothetical protein
MVVIQHDTALRQFAEDVVGYLRDPSFKSPHKEKIGDSENAFKNLVAVVEALCVKYTEVGMYAC